MTKPKKQDNKNRVDPEKNEINPGAEMKSILEFNETWVDKVALFVTGSFGSIRFLGLCIALFVIWISWNLNLLPIIKPFDPYPFQMLTMIVSIFAIILSVSVLISQNREGKRDAIRQQVEFEVNIRAENEITKMLTMLHEIQKKLGISDSVDNELEKMKAETDIKDIHQKLDGTAENNT
jgi:uncharacterized membrane protein